MRSRRPTTSPRWPSRRQGNWLRCSTSSERAGSRLRPFGPGRPRGWTWSTCRSGSGRRSTPRLPSGDARCVTRALRGRGLSALDRALARREPTRAGGQLGRQWVDLLAVDELQPCTGNQGLRRRRSLSRRPGGLSADGTAPGRDRCTDACRCARDRPGAEREHRNLAGRSGAHPELPVAALHGHERGNV